jgi:hypothetical protein
MAGNASGYIAGLTDRDSFSQIIGRYEVKATDGITVRTAVAAHGPARIRVGRAGANQPQTMLLQNQGDHVATVNMIGSTPQAINGRAVLVLDNTDLSTAGIVGGGALLVAAGPCDVSVETTVTGTPGVVVPSFGNDAIRATYGAYVRLVGAPAIGGGPAEADFVTGNGTDVNKTFFAADGDSNVNLADGSTIVRVG